MFDFYSACKRGDLNFVIQCYTNNLIDFDEEFPFNECPIFQAYRNGHYDIVEFIVKNYIFNGFYYDKKGNHIITIAMFDGDFTAIKILYNYSERLHLFQYDWETNSIDLSDETIPTTIANFAFRYKFYDVYRFIGTIDPAVNEIIRRNEQEKQRRMNLQHNNHQINRPSNRRLSKIAKPIRQVQIRRPTSRYMKLENNLGV